MARRPRDGLRLGLSVDSRLRGNDGWEAAMTEEKTGRATVAEEHDRTSGLDITAAFARSLVT
jgi:sporulation-control protein spo0M